MQYSYLKFQIIDTYDDVMGDYLESEDVNYATREWNKRYFSFREKIDPDLRQVFDDLVRDDEDMMQKTAEEALYRGVMIGIAEHDNLFNNKT